MKFGPEHTQGSAANWPHGNDGALQARLLLDLLGHVINSWRLVADQHIAPIHYRWEEQRCSGVVRQPHLNAPQSSSYSRIRELIVFCFFFYVRSTPNINLQEEREKLLVWTPQDSFNIDFNSCTWVAAYLPVCFPVSWGARGIWEGERGPSNSFGSSCIRLNGTNYKSRAISPHYSERTRKGGKGGAGEERRALQLSVGDGRKREERVRLYMKNRYEDDFERWDKEEEGGRGRDVGQAG